MANGLSIGQLREAIIEATELGGVWGQNMHESKEVLLRVDGQTYALSTVSSAFISGRFVMVLDARNGEESAATAREGSGKFTDGRRFFVTEKDLTIMYENVDRGDG